MVLSFVPVSYTHLDVYKRQVTAYGQRLELAADSAGCNLVSSAVDKQKTGNLALCGQPFQGLSLIHIWEKNADLVLATDPDADRLGVYVKDAGLSLIHIYFPETEPLHDCHLCETIQGRGHCRHL